MREALKQLPARSLLVLGWSSVGLTLLACALYGVLPAWKAYRKAAALHDTLSAYALSDVDLTEQITARTRENQALKQKLVGDIGLMPANQLQTYVIDKLQSICWDTGMEMQSVQPASEGKTENFIVVQFNIELVGEYLNWFSWLKKMRNELGFLVIQSYDIKVLTPGESEPQLGFNLKVAAYRGDENL